MDTITCERFDNENRDGNLVYTINGARRKKIIVKKGINLIMILNCQDVNVIFAAGSEVDVMLLNNLQNCRFMLENAPMGVMRMEEKKFVKIANGGWLIEDL